MNYEILETRVEFVNNKIDRIFVLVNFTGNGSKPYSDVRCIYANTKPCSGYFYIIPALELNPSLLQRVAASGIQTYGRDKIFPSWKSRLTKN